MKPTLFACALLVAGCSGCPTPRECRETCESGGLVVSHWEYGGCDCADERAPAYTEVHTRSGHTTVHPVHVGRR